MEYLPLGTPQYPGIGKAGFEPANLRAVSVSDAETHDWRGFQANSATPESGGSEKSIIRKALIPDCNSSKVPRKYPGYIYRL